MLRHATPKENRTIVLHVGADRPTEHGQLEGWESKSGDTITHADSEALELAVP